MYDLALSEHGDLVIAGNRDLAGISGIDLIEQRIRTRLKVYRGSWVYDEDQTFGSNLFQAVSLPPDQVEERINGYVREALQPMDDISVVDVGVVTTSHDATVFVSYQVVDDEIGAEGEIREFQMVVQEASEAEGV